MSATIVVGYTPALQSEAALRGAIEEARRRQARLVLVNASTGDRFSDPHFASEGDLEEVRQTLAESGVPFEIRQPVRGRDGAEEVVLAAEEVAAELIVIGLRRRTAVGKLLLGSTAQNILMRATCDVLAVKQT
jgi:nucleotide-binding universal stress UspA family protein